MNIVEETPILAIAYDFDGTLAKGNMQEKTLIPALGYTTKNFWREVKALAEDVCMDEILAYMYFMVKTAKSKNIPLDKSSLQEFGRRVDYFQGVETFFEKINKYAQSQGVSLEHYIISSGIKEMIEATSIKKYFKAIFASSFKYENGEACWPALSVNYTNKTQYLFRINKGLLEEWDQKINTYMPDEKRRIPFSNMIYIGDGDTDVPAMKMTKFYGGSAIAVYNGEQEDEKTKKAKEEKRDLVLQGRADYFAEANYEEGSSLYNMICDLITIKAKQAHLKLRQLN